MNTNILVAGDSMLDRYWEGDVERISPEAPVPVLRMRRVHDRPGGAANVAMNVAALQRPVTLATLIGDDEAGARLAEKLRERGVELAAVSGRDLCTTQKIRAVCKRQQLLRVDVEEAPPQQRVSDLCERIAALLPAHRWLLLSDYAKGALGDCPLLLQRARAAGCRVLVDPKGDDYERYRGAWLLKPNELEARAAAGRWHDEADFERRMLALRSALRLQHLLVTRGERGMSLFSAERAPLHLAAEKREVYDVSGAGDTVMATLAAALAGGHALEDAARLANHAAGIVVGKFGTASVSVQELQLPLQPWQAAA